MKTKKEIEEFVNERLESLRKDLLEFIFKAVDSNVAADDKAVVKTETKNDNPHILDTKEYIDFEYPSELYDRQAKKESFVIRFTKSNKCLSAYYNNKLIFDGNKEIFHRYYMGRQIVKKYDVVKSKRKEKDIQFNGSTYFVAQTIFMKIPFETSLNESKVKNFITDVIKPYLIKNVFFKD